MSTMEVSGAATLFLLICLSFLLLAASKKRTLSKGKLPPGPTPLPLLGNVLQIKSSQTLKSLLKLWDKYGPVFTVYFGRRPIVVLCGHDAVKEALVDKAEEFSGRKTNPTLDRTFQGHGVVFANGERWKQLRQFSLSVLRNLGMGKKPTEEQIQEEAQLLLEEFRKTKGKPFDPKSFITQAVSNIISSMIFGKRFDYQDKQFQTLVEMIGTAFQEISTAWAQLYDIYVDFLKYFPGAHNKIYALLELLRAFVAEKVKANQQTMDHNCPRDFIDCFLQQMEKEKGNPASEFNMKNLEMTVLYLFFGGTMTVSSTLRSGFLLMIKHPEIQAMVHEEIDRVIGRSEVPSNERRSQMPYTDAVIHEIQRFTDLLPMGLAHMVTHDTEFRGYLIPQGTEVYPVLHSVLHDPEKFKNPAVFNPGRFLDENGHFKKNDAFVPFSLGKRICLGESLARTELFLFFTTILQSFRLKPLVDPKDIDITPQESGFANIPPSYKLCVVPR